MAMTLSCGWCDWSTAFPFSKGVTPSIVTRRMYTGGIMGGRVAKPSGVEVYVSIEGRVAAGEAGTYAGVCEITEEGEDRRWDDYMRGALGGESDVVQGWSSGSLAERTMYEDTVRVTGGDVDISFAGWFGEDVGRRSEGVGDETIIGRDYAFYCVGEFEEIVCIGTEYLCLRGSALPELDLAYAVPNSNSTQWKEGGFQPERLAAVGWSSFVPAEEAGAKNGKRVVEPKGMKGFLKEISESGRTFKGGRTFQSGNIVPMLVNVSIKWPEVMKDEHKCEVLQEKKVPTGANADPIWTLLRSLREQGENVVHITIRNESLTVESEQRYVPTKMSITSIKACEYIERGCHLFLAHVTEKKPKEKLLEDVPVIRDFPKVFPDELPGLPPLRQVEFRIDLLSAADLRTLLRIARVSISDRVSGVRARDDECVFLYYGAVLRQQKRMISDASRQLKTHRERISLLLMEWELVAFPLRL
ncbi:hypothetical protein Tco_0802378 [Tanacetum coccineum]|uniref:Uncharacterized protein n=1 Tax=Tanacetum coccineum TaxID=301880 RepID=A0ABQ5A2N1_9ASTR